MAAISSTAAHQASTCRGSLLYTPLCSPSTSQTTFSRVELASSRVHRRTSVPAAIFRHAPAVVAAAAVLDAEHSSREGTTALDPAVCLSNGLDHAVGDPGFQPLASSSNAANSKQVGNYLGVLNAADAAAGPAANQHSKSEATSKHANSSSSRRRSHPRGRPNTMTVRRLKAQYSSLFEQLEAEQTAMLHKHERDFMELMYSGATQQELEQQQRRHDIMLHKLQSQYSQKWGPPVARKGYFQASGPQHQQRLQQQRQCSNTDNAATATMQQQQQKQENAPASIRNSSPSPAKSCAQQQQQRQPHDATSSNSSSSRTSAAATAQQQRHRRHQKQQPLVTASSAANSSAHVSKEKSSSNTRGSSNSSRPRKGSKHHVSSMATYDESVYSEPTYSAFDFPDDTPEVFAAAAAAQAEAATVQRFTNQMVGAKIVAVALNKDPVDTRTLEGLEIVFLHLALPKFVAWKLTPLMIKLAEYLLTRPDCNVHTYGAIFSAYSLANRTDLALATWEKLSSQGVDIGPYGSSALIKACARQRDVAAALQVFDQLLRRRVSFNSYTYNCLLGLCCSAGRFEDALAVYNLQRLETNPRGLPDAYTYNALMKGCLVSGREELTQQLFENMLEDGVTADPRLYCNFLNGAAKAGNLGLARYLYQHMLLTLDMDNPQQQQQRQQRGSPKHASSSSNVTATKSDHSIDSTSAAAVAADPLAAFLVGTEELAYEESGEPNMLFIVNTLLFAHAQVGAFQGALAVYKQELLGRGLVPDAYTSTALFTAAARSPGISWADVQALVAIMQQHNIELTTQSGTALISAYRRVKVWQRPAAGGSGKQQQQGGNRVSRRSKAKSAGSDSISDAATLQHTVQQEEQELLAATGAPALPGVEHVVAAALHAAREVLQQLHQQKLATSFSYVTMLCFLLEQGQVGSFKQLYGVMQNQGVLPDEQGWEKLLYASEECGMQEMVMQLQQQQDMQQRRHMMAIRAGPQLQGQQQ